MSSEASAPAPVPVHRPGVLIVVSGPSGVGKTTLCRRVMDEVRSLRFSVSCTTRPPRAGERHGVDYYFVSPEEFQRRLDAGEFLEHARVYDRQYGTLRSEVDERLRRGESVLLDIDVQGAGQVRSSGTDAVYLFVLPPSVGDLERRLRERATDDDATVRRRMDKALAEMRHAWRYDYVVVNDDLRRADAEFNAVVRAEVLKRARPAILAAHGLPNGGA
ncbi:guanylate kinase [Myxococcota bacterium]|nr:guanylate kinase [Myxococcota bacterium]